jgi:uridine phosphorylase
MMSDVREIGCNREYLTITGTYEDQQITVASHGVGACSANIVFMELLHGGVHTLIRAGTCGATDPDIDDGDFVIVTGAVREDLATESLMPLAYPAFADLDVLNALIASAKKRGHNNPYTGIGITGANFYPSHVLPSQYGKYMKCGVKTVDLETAPLLVVARMLGARAGSILTSDGNSTREKGPKDPFGYNPYREVVDNGIEVMLKVALGALASLAAAGEGFRPVPPIERGNQ